MTWVLFAIATLTTQIVVANWNRTRKLEPIRLNIWRSLSAILFFSPALFYASWDLDLDIYIAFIFIAIVSTVAQISIFYLSAVHNGRVSLLSTNFSMIFTYLVWILLDPVTQSRYFENPTKAFIISTLILISFVASFFMRQTRRENKKGYLFISMAIGVLITMSTIIGKKMLPQNMDQTLINKLFIMGFIIFLTQFLFSLFIWAMKEKTITQLKRLEPCKYIHKHTFILGILGALGCITSWAAVALAPNPAYIKALIMSAPLIFVIYHKIQNVEDKANPVAGSVVAICVILIILLQT